MAVGNTTGGRGAKIMGSIRTLRNRKWKVGGANITESEARSASISRRASGNLIDWWVVKKRQWQLRGVRSIFNILRGRQTGSIRLLGCSMIGQLGTKGMWGFRLRLISRKSKNYGR